MELWRSDGTPGGTYEVADIAPGPVSSNPAFLTSFQGRLYFAAGSALWQSDGTAQGTVMVREVPAVSLYVVGSRLVFFGTDAAHGFEPWASDGTAAGTRRIADLAKGTSSPVFHAFELVGKRLFFSATASAARGQELYVTDGTVQVGGSDPHGLMTLGETALFFARDGHGPALWRSDGTDAGTTMLKRELSGRGQWTASPDRVFFQADPRQGGFDLWTSDGTEAGTLRLNPDGVRAMNALSAPVIKLGSRVFFSGWTMEHGSEPWTTDGTRAGTRRVADLRPGTAGSSPRDFMVFAGRAFFVARFRLWKSDGTAKGTVALGTELRDIRPWTTSNGRLWFTGRNSRGFTELWATDGTAARTVRIAELRTVEQLTVHGGRLWFLGNATELWSTDGTAAGTRKLDLRPQVYELRAIVSDGLRLYLNDFEHALWVSDGTAAGIRKISDQGAVGPAIAFGGRLFYVSPSGDFYTSDGTEAGTRPVRPDGAPRFGTPLRFGNRLVLVNHGGELWQSDGTEQGTTLIRDLSPAYYYGSEVVKAGPRLFFPAWEDGTGWELWAMRE